ncbi:hypothetical protein Nepgr_009860 [Nepenthes gracilis]|uniref:Uncharacterized protein n=1 Tax=Nepenthes gracilis TaxID=150966 RepID=A0AAD3SC37_NEPGR|nr:hypothetical protein Nepgr_009860 [Nepenthes gracilis]
MSEIQSKEAIGVSTHRLPEASIAKVVAEEFRIEIPEMHSFEPPEPEVQFENVDQVDAEEVPLEGVEAEMGVVYEEEIHEAVEVVRPMSSETEAQVGPATIMGEFQEIMNYPANIAKEFANDYVEKESF